MAGWLDCSAGKNSDADSITNAQTVGSPEKTADVTSKQGNDVELRYACEPTSSHEDCSTSGTHQPEYFRVQQRSRVGGGERSKRKRRRGRDDDVGYTHSVSFNESTKQELSTSTANVSRAHQVILMTQRQPGRVSGHCREGWLSAAAPKGGSLAAASIECPKGWLSDAAWKGGCRLLPGRVAHWLLPGRVAHWLLPGRVAVGCCLEGWFTGCCLEGWLTAAASKGGWPLPQNVANKIIRTSLPAILEFKTSIFRSPRTQRYGRRQQSVSHFSIPRANSFYIEL